jgi:Xaa-Pro dipeptidase
MTYTENPRHIFSRGGDSLEVDLRMHAHLRSKFYSRLRESDTLGDAVILAGGGEVNMYDADTVWEFRQESNFQYLFGVKEPGCFGVLTLDQAISILFVPRFPQEYAQWFGPIKPTEWFKETYLVDHVYYVDEMATVLASEDMTIKSLLYYDYVNQDSGVKLPIPNNFKGSENFKFVTGSGVADIINELRLIKSRPEIEILQYTNDVTCRSHIDTMKALYKESFGKVCSMEHFAETNFKFRSGLEGCARVGYNCIACSGMNNAVLHYGHASEPNNEAVAKGSLRLIDMGAEYHCYTADVTVTFPTNGKFSPDQKKVY